MRYDPDRHDTPTTKPSRSRAPWLVVPALVALVALAQPVAAIPGPDPADAPPAFTIYVVGNSDGETEALEALDFARADNWDFGDREAYRCAYVEYIVGGQVLFKLELERLAVPGQADNYVALNDEGGMESGEGGNPPSPGDLCGMPAGAGPLQFDGSAFVSGGATFTVTRDGSPLATYSLPAVSPTNPESFWSPGNDPGEAYLWYIAPGEANDPVLRFTVVPMASGVSVDGLPAPSPSPTPGPVGDHASDVTLRLSGGLRAHGHVRVPDGTTSCKANRLVMVERRRPGGWSDVGRDLSGALGSYRLHIPERAGTYRARVLDETLATGDVCESATSGPRHWRSRHR